MNPPQYIDLDFEHADFGILQRGRNEPIHIEWDPVKRSYFAISTTCPEVYYLVDLVCDGSGFCTCPSFVEVQSKKGRPCKHIVALDLHIARKDGYKKG
jgi:hypothetical protein